MAFEVELLIQRLTRHSTKLVAEIILDGFENRNLEVANLLECRRVLLESRADLPLFAFPHLMRVVKLLKELYRVVDPINSQVHTIDADVVDPNARPIGGAVSSIG